MSEAPETPPSASNTPDSGASGGQPEPVLRLKLRPKSPADSTTATAPTQPAPEPGPAASKMRLKPRLSADAPTQPAPTAPESTATPEPAQEEEPKPAPTAPPAPPTAIEPPAAPERFVPPFLVVPTEPREPSRPSLIVGPPKVPHIKGPDGTVEIPEPPAALEPVQSREFKVGLAVVATVILLVLLAGGLAAWRFFFHAKPELPAKHLTVSAPAAAKSAPGGGSTLSSLNKLQNLVHDTQSAEQAQVDALAEGKTPPPLPSASQMLSQPAPTTAGPAPASSMTPQTAQSAGPKSGHATAQPPPPLVQMTPAAPAAAAPPREVARVDGPPQASAAFQRFVADASIPGVFQGSPARALINGVVVQSGDYANRELGIIFVGIDAQRKTITFRDASGAELTRNY